MMTIIAILVFSAAFGTATFAIAMTVVPKLDRIADALAGRSQSITPQMRAERRMAVRRWAAPVQAPSVLPQRAAA